MQSGRQRRFDMTYSVRDGMYLRHLQAGAPCGTLVYVHGLGESGLCFERLMADPRLADWDHLAVDLAGYGKSFWDPEPSTLDQHASRVCELLDGARGPVIVLGHSMGGVIGVSMGQQSPDRFHAFVNIEGNVSPPDCQYSGRAVRFTLDEWLDNGFSTVLDSLYAEQGEDPGVLRPYCASIQMCDPRAFHRNSAELVELSAAEKLAEAMAAIDLPSIYIFGAPRGAGDLTRKLLGEAGIEMVGIPDSGHWPFLDQHEAFVNELTAFLGRLDSQG